MSTLPIENGCELFMENEISRELLTCSLSSDLNRRIFLTESIRRDRCSSLFGNMATAPSSSSGSFSGS